jgi:manganese/zinc/iron transport system permease protein
MSAMLVAPGASARQWTDKLSVMLVVAASVGCLCGLAGALVSIQLAVPTGPAIVLCLAGAAVISVLFGSARGLVWTKIRRKRRAAA